MPRSEALALIALAVVCVVGIIILAATGHDIPAILGDLAFVAVGGGAGASLPSRTTVAVPSSNVTTTTPKP